LATKQHSIDSNEEEEERLFRKRNEFVNNTFQCRQRLINNNDMDER